MGHKPCRAGNAYALCFGRCPTPALLTGYSSHSLPAYTLLIHIRLFSSMPDPPHCFHTILLDKLSVVFADARPAALFAPLLWWLCSQMLAPQCHIACTRFSMRGYPQMPSPLHCLHSLKMRRCLHVNLSRNTCLFILNETIHSIDLELIKIGSNQVKSLVV